LNIKIYLINNNIVISVVDLSYKGNTLKINYAKQREKICTLLLLLSCSIFLLKFVACESYTQYVLDAYQKIYRIIIYIFLQIKKKCLKYLIGYVSNGNMVQTINIYIHYGIK